MMEFVNICLIIRLHHLVLQYVCVFIVSVCINYFSYGTEVKQELVYCQLMIRVLNFVLFGCTSCIVLVCQCCPE